jgi:hypothetical protein
MGQSSKDLPLQEERLAFPTTNRTVNKQCTTPTAGRIWEYFAASAHQTGTNEERLWIR